MLWDGAPPTIVLSEKAGGNQKGYHPGDSVGEWRILSIDNQYVVLGWDGKEIQKRIDELIDRTPIDMASAAPKPAPEAAKPAPSSALASPNPSMGIDMGGNVRACVPGDTSAAGTVLSGMKKVITASPFGGATCRWEPAQ